MLVAFGSGVKGQRPGWGPGHCRPKAEAFVDE